MIRLFAFVAATVFLALLSFADEVYEDAGRTALPVTYVMAYGGNVVGNPDFLGAIREAPPDFLHIGHGVPLNSIFGPAADYSGWNPELIGSETILARRKELCAFVDAVHEAGVDKVFCYINPSILGGDHETREGYWAFYDHWDDYLALGIGPKPDRVPEQWMQRDRRTFAPWEPEPDYPLWRYEPCVNEPAWRRYQAAVVRLIAESGYDGVFVDDCIMECKHDICAQRFPDFLRERYTPGQQAEALADDLNLRVDVRGAEKTPAQRLRNAEAFLFWQESIADFIGDIKREARSINPDFFALPNWGAISRVRGATGRARSGKDVAVWSRVSRYQMFEEAHPPGYFGPQDVFDYLLQYKYGLALGVRPVIISYGTGRRYVELGHAECAAGGGGAFVQPGTDFPEIRKKWRRFYETQRDLFEDFRLFAPVGLVLDYEEVRYGNNVHLREAFAASRALHNLHIPFRVVPKNALTAEQPAECRVLILPEVRYLSNAQQEGVLAFGRRGGRILASGDCGTRTLLDIPRDGNWLSGLRDALVHVKTLEELIPKREYEVINALDILEETKFAARLEEIAATAPTPPGDNAFRQTLDRLAGQTLSLATARDTRTVAYHRLQDSEGIITVHAVRYAAPMTGSQTSEITKAPLKITIPIPPGWKPTSAQALGPDRSPVTLDIDTTASAVQCELPPFEFYSMLCLKLNKPTGFPFSRE